MGLVQHLGTLRFGREEEGRMKVLFLSHQADFLFGGEVCTLSYMAELKRQGVEVHFASPAGPYAERAGAIAHWHEIPSVQFSRSLIALPAFLPALLRSHIRLKKIATENRIDLLHATSLKAMVYAWPLRKLLPVLWHHHDILPDTFWNNAWARGLAKGAAQVVVPSKATKDSLLGAGLPESKVQVLHNGFQPGEWHARPARKAGPLTLAFVGEISFRKGADRLAAILSAVRTKVAAELWIIGDSLSDPAFGAQVRAELEPLGAKFWGKRNDVKDLLQSVDVLLVPSRQDPLPTVIVEAGLSGVPVVASPSGGIPEMVKENGFLAADTGEYAQHILELADEEKWKRTSLAARKKSETAYDIRLLTGRLVKIYLGLTK
jgi:glycosyltransferase involved in cell wall biosynthesis